MVEITWDRGGKTHESTRYLFKGFQVVGVNRTQKWKRLSYLYSTLTFLVATFYLPISFYLSYLFNASQMTTNQLITSVQYAINVTGIPVKLINTKLNMSRLYDAKIIMNTLDARCQLKEEFQKIQKCVKFGNGLALIYVFIYCLCTTSIVLASVIMGRPPFALFFPLIDWRNSTLEFSVQAFTEFILMLSAGLNACMTDVSPVIYIYIIRTHIQILVDRVRRLATDKTKSKVTNYEELVNCIKDHQILLGFLDTISPMISLTIFTQFSVTATILSAAMINILLFADASAQIASLVYLLGVVIQITPCCYQATLLLEDGEQLPLAILQCNWMEEDKGFRKMLIFFMQRAQKPMTLTALKLFPITLATNLSIVKFSLSLYTLIRNLDLGQNEEM